jgi:hypothetical protein
MKNKPPSLFRMVYNDHASETLDRYKDGRFTREKALTQLNQSLDYVITSEKDDKRRESKTD